MAMDAPTPVIEPQRPSLTLVQGRKPDRRSAADEAHMELLTLFVEIQVAARVIVNAVTGLPVPSMLAINEAQRLSYRAERAREEWLALTTPDGAA